MYSNPDDDTTFSVSELNRRAKVLLESHFDYVKVEGEIGDFTAASSGHWYFTLKDTSAQVRCAMFRQSNSRLKFRPSKGDSVKIRARVSLYENRGEFQVIVQHMEPAGDGALQLAFERLKARLKDEGLFDAEHKLKIPTACKRVGVITSATGAVIHDVLSVLQRRSPMTEIYLFPVAVQGPEAAPAIVGALEQANRLHETGELPLEVLIVGRGGGSLEDLWAFNEEVVARAIAASRLPVVSAVGHEVDFTISDFVADQRAATPSAAAELVSIDQQEWMQRFDRVQLTLRGGIQRKLAIEQQQLRHLRARLRHPGTALAQRRERLRSLEQRLKSTLTHQLEGQKQQLKVLARRLAGRHPQVAILRAQEQLAEGRRRLTTSIDQKLSGSRSSLKQYQRLLQSLGPENTLARGYAIVEDGDGNILRDATSARVGDAIAVRLSRGRLSATVKKTESGVSTPD